jgi:predicted RNA binding protein YcfA (HicA-like mRNA interferase family)
MKRRDLERHLRDHGCRYIGEGARHAKWRGPAGAASVVPRHNDIAPGTVRAICHQLGIPTPTNPR